MMKTTAEFLDAVKKMHHLESDYALAKLMGVSTSRIANYRMGRSTMDPYTAAKAAELLGVDPLNAIAAMESKRAKNERQREFWRNLMGAMFLGAVTVGSGAPTPAEATSLHNQITGGLNIHYPPKPKRRRERTPTALSGIARTASVLISRIAGQAVPT